jgi:hypothetical protein
MHLLVIIELEQENGGFVVALWGMLKRVTIVIDLLLSLA